MRGSFFFDSNSGTIYLRTIDGTNPSNHTIRTDSAQRELHQSKVEFEQMGLEIDSVIFPYGNHNSDTINLAREYYDAVVPGLTGYNDTPLADPYHLKRLGVANNTEVSEMKEWVEEAITNNDGIVKSQIFQFSMLQLTELMG